MDFITHFWAKLQTFVCLHAFFWLKQHLGGFQGIATWPRLTLRCSRVVRFDFVVNEIKGKKKRKKLTQALDDYKDRTRACVRESVGSRLSFGFKVFVCHHSWHHLSDVDLLNVTTMQHWHTNSAAVTGWGGEGDSVTLLSSLKIQSA